MKIIESSQLRLPFLPKTIGQNIGLLSLLLAFCFSSERLASQVAITSLGDWQAKVKVDYDACNGALSVSFPLQEGYFGPGGNLSDRLGRVDIYIKRPNHPSEQLTSVYRTSDNVHGLDKSEQPFNHVPSSMTVTTVSNNTLYKFSTRVGIISTTQTFATVSSFTKLQTADFTQGTLVFPDLPDYYFNQDVDIIFTNGSWQEGVGADTFKEITDYSVNSNPLKQTVPSNTNLIVVPKFQIPRIS